jgi:uncharacterized protein VirK/YbjX
MDKEKIKLIIRNMELLLDSLKGEILSDGQPYKYRYDDIRPQEVDYDEIFGEDYKL